MRALKLNLSSEEIELLKEKGIRFGESECSDDEALELLEQVREVEVSYSQFTTGPEAELYYKYGDLADKIQSQIPED